MIDNPAVLYSGIAIAISIALFNFFGLSVTRHVSATARSLTDTCRTLSIWIVSLGLGWEKLLFPISLLQVVGFTLLVYVMSILPLLFSLRCTQQIRHIPLQQPCDPSSMLPSTACRCQ